MVRTRRYRGVFWGIGLVVGIVAIGLVWWLRPDEDRVFVVDATWSHLMRAAREGDPAARARTARQEAAIRMLAAAAKGSLR